MRERYLFHHFAFFIKCLRLKQEAGVHIGPQFMGVAKTVFGFQQQHLTVESGNALIVPLANVVLFSDAGQRVDDRQPRHCRGSSGVGDRQLRCDERRKPGFGPAFFNQDGFAVGQIRFDLIIGAHHDHRCTFEHFKPLFFDSTLNQVGNTGSLRLTTLLQVNE